MQLPRDGVEYAHLTFGQLPGGATVEASIDRETWAAVTLTGGAGLFLLRGPDAASTDGLLVPDDATLWVRVSDTPEILPRIAGTIHLY